MNMIKLKNYIKMRKLSKLFYIKPYGLNAYYVFYTEWTIKRFLGLKWVSRNGLSYVAYKEYKDAVERLRNEKKSYIHAKKIICK